MIHFSVDDTITIFENLTKENYNSCFEEPTLAFLKKLNEQYGLKVSMYCFFESASGFNLSDTNSAKTAIGSNSVFTRLTPKRNMSSVKLISLFLMLIKCMIILKEWYQAMRLYTM